MNVGLFLKEYERLLDKNGSLSASEKDFLELFLTNVVYNWKEFSLDQWAYVFATVFHETAHTFAPVREAFWLSENWRKTNLRYYPYYGRGFVQITWRANYEKFSTLMGVDFVKNPDAVMNGAYAFKILMIGMRDGLFTGKKLAHYINDKQIDFVNARRVINGTDKAVLISKYAEIFRTILKKSI